MWKCEMCDTIFSDPASEKICAEDYYGVSSMFSNRNYIYLDICPECGSEEIERYYEEDDDL